MNKKQTAVRLSNMTLMSWFSLVNQKHTVQCNQSSLKDRIFLFASFQSVVNFWINDIHELLLFSQSIAYCTVQSE